MTAQVLKRDGYPPGVPCVMPAGSSRPYFIARLDGLDLAEAVNANGTWNWSELNTRDPEAA
jgi:hypothetical protein